MTGKECFFFIKIFRVKMNSEKDEREQGCININKSTKEVATGRKKKKADISITIYKSPPNFILLHLAEMNPSIVKVHLLKFQFGDR